MVDYRLLPPLTVLCGLSGLDCVDDAATQRVKWKMRVTSSALGGGREEWWEREERIRGGKEAIVIRVKIISWKEGVAVAWVHGSWSFEVGLHYPIRVGGVFIVHLHEVLVWKTDMLDERFISMSVCFTCYWFDQQVKWCWCTAFFSCFVCSTKCWQIMTGVFVLVLLLKMASVLMVWVR